MRLAMDHLRGNTDGGDMGGQIADNGAAGTDDCVGTDTDTLDYRSPDPHMGVGSDVDLSRQGGSWGDVDEFVYDVVVLDDRSGVDNAPAFDQCVGVDDGSRHHDTPFADAGRFCNNGGGMDECHQADAVLFEALVDLGTDGIDTDAQCDKGSGMFGQKSIKVEGIFALPVIDIAAHGVAALLGDVGDDFAVAAGPVDIQISFSH